ncbi:hypothetical protein FGO68_gene14694 [Halteria grandinella]|uniref:Uncharacterized protein n=1 Tax=Halteria grandinella TaxID=5974 RepID=A0A8J8SV63_HALGN|nr:hypothetical protein FGO68_gene14694 [Halteria grandinella]
MLIQNKFYQSSDDGKYLLKLLSWFEISLVSACYLKLNCERSAGTLRSKLQETSSFAPAPLNFMFLFCIAGKYIPSLGKSLNTSPSGLMLEYTVKVRLPVSMKTLTLISPPVSVQLMMLPMTLLDLLFTTPISIIPDCSMLLRFTESSNRTLIAHKCSPKLYPKAPVIVPACKKLINFSVQGF